jgi:hypothetical protein
MSIIGISARKLSSLPSWLRRALAAVVLIAAAGIAYALGVLQPTHFSSNAPSVLLVQPGDLDFGEVLERDTFSWILPVTNCSEHEVHIVDIQSSCACVSVEPKEVTIAPRQTTDVQLTLDLIKSKGNESVAHIRDCEIQLMPVIAGQTRKENGWILRGRVRSLFTLTPPVLDYWDGVNIGAPYPTKRVTIQGNEPLTDIVVKCDSSQFKTTLLQDGADGQKWELEVSPADTLSPGYFSGSITVQGITADRSCRTTKTIPVAGVVHSDVQVFPSKVTFGFKRIGDSDSQRLTVSSKSGNSFEIDRLETSSADLSICVADSAPTGCKLLRLTQRCTDSGQHSSVVTVGIREGTGTRYSIPVNISYAGASAQADNQSGRGGP